MDSNNIKRRGGDFDADLLVNWGVFYLLNVYHFGGSSNRISAKKLKKKRDLVSFGFFRTSSRLLNSIKDDTENQ